MQKIIIIGAGPIGIETALYAQRLGFNPIIIERDSIASNLKKWGHVTFFSPFYMNSSPLGREISQNNIKYNEYCTADNYIKNYLYQISEKLKNKIFYTEVLSISRKNILKNELIGSKLRTDKSFIIHLKDNEKEFYLESDIVIDCSGTYNNPSNFGMGGLKIINQNDIENKINHYIPDINGKDRDRYINKTILLIGTGYSAATSANLISNLSENFPETKIYWFSRNNEDKPYKEIENDILELRKKLINDSNNLISNKNFGINFFHNTYVENIEKYNDKLKILFNQDGVSKEIIVDEIISNTGYKPNNKVYEELQIHECYATQGTMKLAASLLGQNSTDCLNQNSTGLETLKNPEPNFYIIGNKSYGRNSNFILKVGYNQIVDIFKIINDDPSLDLYKVMS